MSQRPRLDHSRTMVIGAALAVAITIGASACSRSTGAAVAVSATATAVHPPSSPVPRSASRPEGSPTPRPVVEPVPLARSTPVHLRIAAIGVDSGLMDLGLQADGSLAVPPSGFPAGWYTGGPTPGELGPAIIAGHIDWNGPGVFYNLHNLKPGDQVTVTRADGSQPAFRVTRVAQFPKDQFPTKLVYGNIDNAGLRLITCGGSFNSQTGHYEDNIVVFADLMGSTR
jgi:hypothetical protein